MLMYSAKGCLEAKADLGLRKRNGPVFQTVTRVKIDSSSYGCGSKINHYGTAGFSPCFHLPGFHFGYLFFPNVIRMAADDPWGGVVLPPLAPRDTPRQSEHQARASLIGSNSATPSPAGPTIDLFSPMSSAWRVNIDGSSYAPPKCLVLLHPLGTVLNVTEKPEDILHQRIQTRFCFYPLGAAWANRRVPTWGRRQGGPENTSRLLFAAEDGLPEAQKASKSSTALTLDTNS